MFFLFHHFLAEKIQLRSRPQHARIRPSNIFALAMTHQTYTRSSTVAITNLIRIILLYLIFMLIDASFSMSTISIRNDKQQLFEMFLLLFLMWYNIPNYKLCSDDLLKLWLDRGPILSRDLNLLGMLMQRRLWLFASQNWLMLSPSLIFEGRHKIFQEPLSSQSLYYLDLLSYTLFLCSIFYQTHAMLSISH